MDSCDVGDVYVVRENTGFINGVFDKIVIKSITTVGHMKRVTVLLLDGSIENMLEYTINYYYYKV